MQTVERLKSQYFAVDSLFCIYLLFYFSKHDHLEMEWHFFFPNMS